MADYDFDCVVIGGGPGGYAAAFRCADLGIKVGLIEQYPVLGGTCLNVGCIPSKLLLHHAEVVYQHQAMKASGIFSSKIKSNIKALLKHKTNVVQKLNQGIDALAKQRKVTVIQGKAQFKTSHSLTITKPDDGTQTIVFKHCIIATGSSPITLPFIPKDKRIFNSTGALNLTHTQGKLIILGGGIIGCEMATIYHSLGTEVHIIEAQDQLMPGTDQDLVKQFTAVMKTRGVHIHTSCQVQSVTPKDDHLAITYIDSSKQSIDATFDMMLTCIGRKPNTARLNLDTIGVATQKGFISVNSKTLQTSQSHIYAIGDVIGNPMLAHKSTAQGHTVAEIIAGMKVIYDVRAMPSVAYTIPEVAWVGLTEQEATAQNIPYEVSTFPWAASGRALCMDQSKGLTKLIYDPVDGRVLGGAVMGQSAGELISEIALSIEMGANIEDIALTIRPHPTLSETIGLASEIGTGTITDFPNKKAKPYQEHETN
ncbi:MAG: dihydrolipoyl dehydrogenase [Pseudomonadota bacterium]|nr:dihydrolipoyl dehydrogenase [Pseudomonadota bacterium]